MTRSLLVFGHKIAMMEEKGLVLRRIVVFDSGQGGELFADRLEDELPIVEVIRVIDWRNSERIAGGSKMARRAAEVALRPYIGMVDLIVFANQLLTLTSLNYFRKKYKEQRFIGLGLERVNQSKKTTVVLTTHALSKTIRYKTYLFRMRGKSFTACFDTWPDLIDSGVLTRKKVQEEMRECLRRLRNKPKCVVLGCSHFGELKDDIRDVFGHNVKICDDVEETIRNTYKILRIRGMEKRKG